jgi:excinuclease ABC subunit A
LRLWEYKSSWIFRQLEIIGENMGSNSPIRLKNPEEAMEMILNGGKEKIYHKLQDLEIARDYKIDFEGISLHKEPT